MGDCASGLFAGSGENYGGLRREGATVARPAGEHSPAVHALLRHLHARGFDGAPWVLWASAEEEALAFIEGEVPVPPEPPGGGWPVVSDARAVSVADLLAHFHAAARSFVPPPWARWRGGFTPGLVHSTVCHNDPVVGNVVFRGDRAVALIDFDFAGPNDPLRDLPIAVQHWVPLADPEDFSDPVPGWSPVGRFNGMSEAYGLDPRRERRSFKRQTR